MVWYSLTFAVLRKLRSIGNEVEWITPSRDPMPETVKFSSCADSVRKTVLEAEGGNFGDGYLNKSDQVRC